MKIYRDGKEIELTQEEMNHCFDEVKKQRSDDLFALVTSKNSTLPYPENAFFSLLYSKESELLHLYINSPESQKQDIIKGFMWAIDTLPEPLAEVIVSAYQKKYISYSQKLKCSPYEAMRKLENAIFIPPRLVVIRNGYAWASKFYPSLGENGQKDREDIRNWFYYRFSKPHKIYIHELGLSMESQKILLQSKLSRLDQIRRWLKYHKIDDIPGITPQIKADIQDALDFICQHYDYLNDVYQPE